MKRIMILLVAVMGLNTIYAQNGDYFFSKTMTVGCYNANPLTDMTKKISVSITDGIATVEIASLNCKKEFNAVSLGKFGSKGDAFYDSKEGRGIIIEENTVLYYFKKEEDKYEIVAVAHTDKKVAKTLTTDAATTTYAASFAKIDNLLEKAKEEQEAAEKLANTLPIPEGNYTDKFGISGKYYLSQSSELVQYAGGNNGPKKYAEGVQIEFDTETNSLKIHYADGKFDKAVIDDRDVYKGVKEGTVNKIHFFKCDHMNAIYAFRNSGLLLLEDGTFLITSGGEHCGSFYNKLDCSGIEFQSPKDKAGNPIIKYIILGKNKERVEELAKDFDQMETLGIAATLANCQQGNALEAAGKPMPAEGMKDAKLKAEATAVIKARAISAHWAQSVDYVYITGTDWYTIRNKNTGIITGRSISGVAVLKTAAGNCQWEEIFIKQDFNGSTYGKSYYGGETQIIVPVDCNEAKKYK